MCEMCFGIINTFNAVSSKICYTSVHSKLCTVANSMSSVVHGLYCSALLCSIWNSLLCKKNGLGNIAAQETDQGNRWWILLHKILCRLDSLIPMKYKTCPQPKYFYFREIIRYNKFFTYFVIITYIVFVYIKIILL